MFLKRHIGLVIKGMIVGAVISFCYVAGETLETTGTLPFFDKLFYARLLLGTVIIGITMVFLVVVRKRLHLSGCKRYSLIERWLQKIEFDIPVRGGYAAILMICWLPTWLSIYPGAFNYDAYNEWLQVHTADISSHHPVLHVLMVGGIVEGVFQLTGSYNWGIALYTFVQMVIVASVFEYTLRFLKEKNVCGLLRFMALAFYACSPVIQLFAISATKDVIFSVMALLFLISILRIMEQESDFLMKKSWQLFFGVSALGTMIFRNNGLYIVVFMLIFVTCFVKKARKTFLKLCGFIIGIYIIYTGPFYHVLGVTAGGVEEMLSVPIQQIARVHFYEKDSIREADLELIYSVLPEEYLNAYRPTISDFVKVGFDENEFRQRKLECLRVWVRLGMEHPLTYINSFLLGTVDFWYPHAVVDGYMDAYGKSSYFDYRVDMPGTEVVLCKRLHERYESLSWDKSAQKIPGMFLIVNPGWYFIMFFVVLGCLWMEGRYKKIAPLMVIVCNMLTVLLGPIALVRYVLILFFAFPLYFVVMKR